VTIETNIPAGAQIQIDVNYDAANQSANFDVWVNGVHHPAHVSGVGSNYYNGSSTEAIDERNCYSADPVTNQCTEWTNYLDYGYNNWFTLQERPSLTGSWTPFGSVSGDVAVILYQDGAAGGDQMTVPTNLASTTFTDTWERSE
jgi:hypothetical protein